jgi:hypothetical protein
MTTIVFDDAGRDGDENSLELRNEIYRRHLDFDLTTYLIDNLGFIALSWKQRNACTIRLGPALASPIGLAAALFALADLAPKRVVISYPSEGCGYELFADLGRAIARVEELMATARRATDPKFLKQELSVDSLLQTGGALSMLLRRWIDGLGLLPSEPSRTALRSAPWPFHGGRAQCRRSPSLHCGHWARFHRLG